MFQNAILLLIAVALSIAPQVWVFKHDAAALAAVVAEHEAEIAAHGHAHEELDLEQHAFDDHWFEIADSDHSSAWLTPLPCGTGAHPGNGAQMTASTFQRDGPIRPFERPPRA